MYFFVITTPEVLEFIGLYIPIIVIFLCGALISKLIHNKIPTFVMLAIGIVISVINIIGTFEHDYYSFFYKTAVFVVLAVVVAMLGIGAIGQDVRKKEPLKINHESKICQSCGEYYKLGSKCPKCGAEYVDEIKS